MRFEQKVLDNRIFLTWGINITSGFFMQAIRNLHDGFGDDHSSGFIEGYDQGAYTGLTFYPGKAPLTKKLVEGMIEKYGNKEIMTKFKDSFKKIAKGLEGKGVGDLTAYVFEPDLKHHYAPLQLNSVSSIEHFLSQNWENPILITDNSDYTILSNCTPKKIIPFSSDI